MTNLEPVARAICTACGENPDHTGDARGDQYRWQDYIDVAQAAIAAVEPIPDDEVAIHIRSMDLDLREDMCAFSFRSGVRWAEKRHGIEVTATKPTGPPSRVLKGCSDLDKPKQSCDESAPHPSTSERQQSLWQM